MATPNEKLAASLKLLKQAQDRGQHVFQAGDFTRTHRERLRAAGFLADVVKGWFVVARPTDRAGDSTAWYASFFEFIAAYCNVRFGADWYLSPETSLRWHAGNTTIPQQVIVHTKTGSNNNIALKFDTALFDYKAKGFAPAEDIVIEHGLQLLSLPATLIRTTPTAYTENPLEIQVALAQIRDASALLVKLLSGGHTVVAGRIAGALRAIGREDDANRIVTTMRAAGYAVNEQNSLKTSSKVILPYRPESPCSTRIRLMWDFMRTQVINTFPPAPGIPHDIAAYIADVNDKHVTDAYHSLSIEGYQVTEALIAKIASGAWSPDENAQDKQDRNALAAKGYHQAFERVRTSVERVLLQENAGSVAKRDHYDWYMQLFEPLVRAGVLEAKNLAGYRSWPVYIRNARHVPPSHDAVRDAMPTFFELLINETDPGVRAVLGHLIFVYIHPYTDGNGRMARFLMNTMLASGGYPWTVITVSKRNEYMAALDQASTYGNIAPFAQFVGNCVTQQMP
jgi:hypothetical protein